MPFEQALELDPSQNQNKRPYICPDCGKPGVEDTEYEQIGDGVWFVYMKCTDCEWGETQTLSGEEEIERFDRVMDERDALVGAFAAAKQRSD